MTGKRKPSPAKGRRTKFPLKEGPCEDGSQGTEKDKHFGIRSRSSSTETQEDNPEAILGLEHPAELPLDQSLGDDSDDSSEDSDSADFSEEEENVEGAEDHLKLSTPRPFQTELMNRLVNDFSNSVKFSDIATVMGGAEEDDLENQSKASKDEAKEAEEPKPGMGSRELSPFKARRGRGFGGRRGTRLPATLQSLLGQANIAFCKNDWDEAIKMCLEVIRQFPNSPSPYETLSTIYTEMSLPTKALHYDLMAAFTSNDPDKWNNLANLYVNNENLDEAVYCYSRVIKLRPDDLSVHYQRIKLLHQLDHQPRLLKSYMYMLKFLKPDQAEEGLKCAKEVANTHYRRQNYLGAKEAMVTAFEKFPSFVSHEDVNLLLDILITMENFQEGLQNLQTYAGVKLIHPAIADSDWDNLSVSEQARQASCCQVPEDVPMDIRSKLISCLIMLGALEIAQPLVDELTSQSTEMFGDLFIETAEWYLKSKNAQLCMAVLRKLFHCPKYKTVSSVWKLYAEAQTAHHGTSNDEAIQAYYKVLKYNPENASARLTLASILLERQLDEAALQVLTEEAPPYSSQVVYEKCLLLEKRGQEELFVQSVSLLLGRHFTNIRSIYEAEVLMNNKKASNKFEALRETRESKNEPLEDAHFSYHGNDVPISCQWDLFVKACKILYRLKKYSELERLTYGALGSREFTKEYLNEVEFYCLQASMANNNSYFAFNLMRSIVTRMPNKTRVWNLLNQVIIKADDIRHNRYLLRLSGKTPNCLALSMLNGHNCLVAGTYKYCLAEYMKVFKKRQSDPLASLMLGMTYVHMACQKFSADKNALVTQAWVFLNSYRELRGDCQETFYNIGRAMHQLSIYHQALYYYEMALEQPALPSKAGLPSLDLSKEIAFNLALLYKKSCPAMSRYYIRKFITV